jgi:hypothetical protein
MQPSRELDTNINVLHALMRPRERLPRRAIADAVGCSGTLIYLIEKKALRKVREQLRKNLQMNHGEFAQQKVSEHL